MYKKFLALSFAILLTVSVLSSTDPLQIMSTSAAQENILKSTTADSTLTHVTPTISKVSSRQDVIVNPIDTVSVPTDKMNVNSPVSDNKKPSSLIQKVFADSGNSAGIFKEWVLPTNDSFPDDMHVDKSGNLFYNNLLTNKIGKLNPNTNVFTEWAIPEGTNETIIPVSLAMDSSDNLFVLGSAVAKIMKLNPSTNKFTIWTLPDDEGYGTTIRLDSSGMLYIVEQENNKIGRLDPKTNIFTEWTIPTQNSGAFDLIVHTDNQIYFTESSASKIGILDPKTNMIKEINVPSPTGYMLGSPVTMVFDSDNLFFTDADRNAIGRLSLSTNEVTEWTVPSTSHVDWDTVHITPGNETSGPFVITMDKDHRLFFTEQDANKIGMLSLGGMS